MKKTVYRSSLWVSLFSLLVLWSCTHRKVSDEGLYHLDIRSITGQEPEVFNLTDLANGINYIPLETNDSCLLARIDNIVMVNDHIFISDGMNLFQFSLSGNFVRQIGRTGKGPGEHGRRIKFDIDVDLQEVLIFSSNVMSVYDLGSGTYKRRFLINQDVSDFHILPQGNIVFLTYELPVEAVISSVCEVFLIDSDGTVIDSISNFDRLNNESNSRGYATTFEFKKNEIRYLFNYRDTLYKITTDLERIPHAVFDLENKISRNNLYIEPVYDEIQFSEFLWIPQIFENAQYIFITAEKGLSFLADKEVHHIIFDKKSGELISTSTNQIQNNIDGGLAFWPRYASGNKLISYHLPFEILNHYNSGTSVTYSDDFETLVKNLNENDNPVLAIIQ